MVKRREPLPDSHPRFRSGSRRLKNETLRPPVSKQTACGAFRRWSYRQIAGDARRSVSASGPVSRRVPSSPRAATDGNHTKRVIRIRMPTVPVPAELRTAGRSGRRAASGLAGCRRRPGSRERRSTSTRERRTATVSPISPEYRAFTPAHRGGAGPPLVCLHGFMETWRTWELVLPALERRHDVLAPTLPGHAGGPALEGAAHRAPDGRRGRARHGRRGLRHRPRRRQLARRLRRAAARRAGPRANRGGLRARGRLGARATPSLADVLALQAQLHEQARATAPHAEAIVATAEGRRRATQLVVVELRAHPG